MKILHNKDLIPYARDLRKNMTKEERKLWYEFLRDYPVKFTRQKIIKKYIADFYCAEAKLVIELDGSQHYIDNNIEKDQSRTDFLSSYGITVLRLPNNYLKENFKSACDYINSEVRKRIKK